MSAYRMEIGWAVDAQLGMLREELLKIDDLELMKDSLIRTCIASAPVDESLFDSLVLYIVVEADGTSHLKGVMTEFCYPQEDKVYEYDIKSCPSLAALKEWVFQPGARKICEDAF